jgi:outer membrane immunogenic protein
MAERQVAIEQHSPVLSQRATRAYFTGSGQENMSRRRIQLQGGFMLRRVVLACASMVALASSVHADAYGQAGPGGYAPALFSWTGFYVGVNGGFGVASRTVTFNGNNDVTKDIQNCNQIVFPGSTCPGPVKSDLDGGVVGGQVGYNWQFSRRWVVGIEADFDASDIRGNGTSRFMYPIFTLPQNVFFAEPANLHSTEDLNWFGTVKGRLGLAPTERSLLFISGGLAYGQVHQSFAVNLPNDANLFGGADHAGYGCGPTGGAGCFLGNNSKFGLGYTVGGGLEIAVTNNVTVKSEYSYLNLGGSGATNVGAQSMFGGIGFSPASFTATSNKLDYHIVRFGVSFKTD